MSLNIKTKIIFITMLILLLAMGATIVTSRYFFGREYTKVLQSETLALGKSLKLQLDRLLRLGIPLEDLIGFEEQCQEIVNKYEGIQHAMVVDLNGKILFHNDPVQKNTLLTDADTLKAVRSETEVIRVHSEAGNEHYDVLVPVFSPNGQHIATVIVAFPLKLITQKTHQLAAYSAAVALGALGLAAWLLFFALSTWVTNPLTQLLAAIREIGKGADFTRRVQIASRDEIGQLEAAFNQMTDELQTTTVSKVYLDNILGSMIDALAVVDGEGKIRTVNTSTCELLKYKEGELVGRPVEIIFAGKEEEIPLKGARLQQLMETGELKHYETYYQTKEGEKIPMLFSASVFKEKAGGDLRIVCTGKDITEKRKMEEELFKAQKLDSIGILAGGIAHDFNNVLTAIMSNISLAMMYMTPEDKGFRVLTDAEQACLRAKDLTQQLLTFAKGGAPIKKIASVAKLLADTTRFALSGSNVKAEFALAPDLWTAEIDEGQMTQVLNNLIINAQQAMTEGGILRVSAENVILAKDEVLSLPAGNYVKISIKDQGKGIAQEHLPKIFDPFFTTKAQGNGLGLSTAYSIVKRHEGYITVESELGAGTTFYLYLPASLQEVTAKRVTGEVGMHGQGRILIMDDEEVIRNAASLLLGHVGYQVECARDGEEALLLYQRAREAERPFDVVILDLTIPGGMGGGETIKRLKEMDPEVKAIVSSGYSNDPIMANFREYGFCGVVAKPYKIKYLNEVLQRVIMEKGL